MENFDYVSIGTLITGAGCLVATYVVNNNYAKKMVKLLSLATNNYESYLENNKTFKEIAGVLISLNSNKSMINDSLVKLLQTEMKTSEDLMAVKMETKETLANLVLDVQNNFKNIINDMTASEKLRNDDVEKLTANIKEQIGAIFTDFSELETSKVNSIDTLRQSITDFTEVVHLINIEKVVAEKMDENTAKVMLTLEKVMAIDPTELQKYHELINANIKLNESNNAKRGSSKTKAKA